MGSSLLGKTMRGLAGFFGSVIGAATGFIWNARGENSLTDDQKRQLPGFMCLLPKDKLEIYLKALFHMSGQNHARIPFNHFTTADQYPDKLAAVLGRSEMSFTFTLSDNLYLRNYDLDSGNHTDPILQRTSDIGQEKDGFVALVDDATYMAPPSAKETQNKDPRVRWDGYGFIIEGFNVKCEGKVPFTLTCYSPQGYLYADKEGELKEGEKEYRHPWNRPSYAVWRGQYLSQAQYSDDSRLWQNTKNLAKPHHRAYVPPRYPRACLPFPPVDLKNPLKWGKEKEIRIKTNYVNRNVGDIFNDKQIDRGDGNYETQRVLVAYWDIPEDAIKIKSPIKVAMDSFGLGDSLVKLTDRIFRQGGPKEIIKYYVNVKGGNKGEYSNSTDILHNDVETIEERGVSFSPDKRLQFFKFDPPSFDRALKYQFDESFIYSHPLPPLTISWLLNRRKMDWYFIRSFWLVMGETEWKAEWNYGDNYLTGGRYEQYRWWSDLPYVKTVDGTCSLDLGINIITFVKGWLIYMVNRPYTQSIRSDLVKNLKITLPYKVELSYNPYSLKLELWVASEKGGHKGDRDLTLNRDLAITKFEQEIFNKIFVKYEILQSMWVAVDTYHFPQGTPKINNPPLSVGIDLP